MVSSELPEVLGMSDRIMVVREGLVRGIIGQAEADQEKIMDIGYGRYLIMNENKNKVINYAQDFGALIALIPAGGRHQHCQQVSAPGPISCPCCASLPLTDSLPSA